MTREQQLKVVDFAEEMGIEVGCYPDYKGRGMSERTHAVTFRTPDDLRMVRDAMADWCFSVDDLGKGGIAY